MAAFAGLRNRGAGGAGRDAAIDQQSLAGDIPAGFRGEKDDRAIQVVHVTGTLHRNAIDEVVDPLLILVKHLVLRGAKPSRREAVDGNAARTPVIGETHGELAHATTAGAVGREPRIAKDAGNRTDVDDAAIAMLDHASRNRLRDKESAPKICVEHQVPILPGDIERRLANIAARVIHQNVNLREPGVYLRGHAVDAGPLA